MVHKLRPALLALLILVAALAVARPWGANDLARCRAAGPEHGQSEAQREAAAANPMYAGPGGAEAPCGDHAGQPESFLDLAQASSARAARAVAPGTRLAPGAYRAAMAQRAALPSTGGTWTPYGRTPLVADRTAYDTTNGSTSEGLADLSGRVTSFASDPAGDHIFAAASNGGVWMTTDRGSSWSSIGDNLPTQVVSGMAWSPAEGGTLVVLTGDNAFGGDSLAGLGVYRTTDLGAHWSHAGGVPDGVLGFKVAVDPTRPNVVYAATGGGLFRSTDAGASFTNVNLPTGEGRAAGTPDCTGRPITAKDCFLANVVTDVVVQGAANAQTTGANAQPGAVLAAVGWRAGQKPNADGAQQSPSNGIYESGSGEPGTFKNLDLAGNATPVPPDVLTQARIGRIALGIADGAAQDHRVVYALVQDAVKFDGGLVGLDANENGTTGAAQSDYLNGLWASTDFGRTWKMIEGSSAIDNDPSSNSALAPPTCKTPALISYCPGIQAWYNLWVQPDPTQSTASGVPTRLAFGLEELWQATAAGGLDGTPAKASVVGRYYAGQTCTLLNATNGLPVCPAASGGTVPKTTTHPDQHGYLWVPDAGGGVTLFAGNDGGIYKQHVAAGGSLSNDNWGRGANAGLNTLQPYDAAMAKDGTVYMGLQDNGEGKIDPDGTAYTIFGGDGFFTAVDPDNADHAFEEYTQGAISATKDGGRTWTGIQPTNMSDALFSTPFEMDPNDAGHLIIGGRQVEETTQGVDTTSAGWQTVFDLGTRKHPGDASAQSSADDPVNHLSAVAVTSIKVPGNAATGPHTPDFARTGGANTLPLGQEFDTGTPLDPLTLPPGSYEDTSFTIGRDDGDAAVLITLKGATESDDWDLYVYRQDATGRYQPVGSSATSSSIESVNIANPPAGRYLVRVVNFNAGGEYSLTGAFTQRTDPSASLSAAYVGFCGYCDTITQGTPFGRGLATNVGGDKPGKAGTGDGWHIARAAGLPTRIITSVRMDPANPSTVYVTLGGYGRRWAFPGAVGEDTSAIGTGHVFRSTDAGATFTDVSGDLPDAPADWSVLHDGHLVVGTDVGVFESCDDAGGAYSVLGGGLPAAPISTLRFKPGDPNLLVAATYGRGVYTYRFGAGAGRCPAKAPAQASGASVHRACATAAAFGRAQAAPRGRGLRFTVSRLVARPFSVDVLRTTGGGRVLAGTRVAHFAGRSAGFAWSGRGAADGYYVVRFRLGADTRSVALVHSHGRFHARPALAARSCTLVGTAALSGPAWGGRTNRALAVTFRLIRSGSVTVTFSRGARVVKRVALGQAGTSAHRVTLSAARLARGDYRVTIAAAAASLTQRVVLTSRKL